MLEPGSGPRQPLGGTSMALRVAVLGGIAFALFAVVFFRLWYLQVLSGDQYLAQANDNRVRVERTPAPRGAIVDRNDLPLVENRRANVVALKPASLPQAILSDAARYGQLAGRRERRPKGKKGDPVPFPPLTDETVRRRYAKLARPLGLPVREIHRRVISALVQAPYASVTLKTDASDAVRDFLEERKEDFPGIESGARFLRSYPYEGLAAQLFGTIGEVNPDQLKEQRFRGVTQGTVVGQEGLEATYDRYLRGVDGSTRVIVDASNTPRGTRAGRDPVPGKRLKLSLDLGLQQTLQRSLSRLSGGLPGAALAMDPRTGEVLAMTSLPTFDPKVLSKPITKPDYDRRFGEDAGAPRFNRAVSGLYPTGSTFKPITALAGLDAGVTTPGRTINDTGCLKIGRTEADVRCNAKKQPYGAVALEKAMTVSSDVYFYTLGLELNPLAGQPLQTWARKLGLGRKTGIDLPGDYPGLVPDREWRDDVNDRETACRKRNKIPLSAGPAQGCGIADGSNRPWTAGDNVGLSIGQGDLQTSPLQMAVAYAAIANGGTIVRPHVGLEVEDDAGRLVQRLDPGRTRKVKIEPAWRDAIMAGLKGAASGPGGTSTDVFGDWDHGKFPVYGKTGTAQRVIDGQLVDQSWYVAYAHQATPEGKPVKEVVMVATVEKGGFGAERAAPAVCEAMWKWFTTRARKCEPGSSGTL